MSLLSWNCRGFGNLRTVNALKNVVKQEEPTIVFLVEMKSDLEWMIKVRDLCKFKNGLIVPSRGKSGGLAMFWKEGIKLDIQTYSNSHIDALVDGGD